MYVVFCSYGLVCKCSPKQWYDGRTKATTRVLSLVMLACMLVHDVTNVQLVQSCVCVCVCVV